MRGEREGGGRDIQNEQSTSHFALFIRRSPSCTFFFSHFTFTLSFALIPSHTLTHLTNTRTHPYSHTAQTGRTDTIHRLSLSLSLTHTHTHTQWLHHSASQPSPPSHHRYTLWLCFFQIERAIVSPPHLSSHSHSPPLVNRP